MTRSPPPSPPNRFDNRPLVLVVDDQEQVRGMYTRMLERNGFRTIGAPSAEAALLILENLGVDLVMTDYKMAGATGIELLDKVRDRWPGVGRLLVTGYLESELAKKAKGHRVLPKEISWGMLRTIIMSEIGKKR